MLEFLLCSSLTILPDFLFRRFAQGKRIGREITLFSVWYELRWGITACVLLTLTLITVIFYFHPATNSAISYFRTVPVLPETVGRVAEVFVGLRAGSGGGHAAVQARQLRAAGRGRERPTAHRRGRRGARGREDRAPGGRGSHRRGPGRLRSGPRRVHRPEPDCSSATPTRYPSATSRRPRPSSRPARARSTRAIASKSSTEAEVNTLLPAQKASAQAGWRRRRSSSPRPRSMRA